MSMQQISAAGDAMNACAAAFIGKKDEIDAALAAAQAGYDGLAANLKAVVSDVTQVSISFAPAAVESDLRNGGVFRNFAELLTFVEGSAAGSRILVLLPNATTLTSTSFLSMTNFGNRHLLFKAIDYEVVEANRPVFKIGIFDGVMNNQWYTVDPGNGGTVIFENVNIEFDTNINAALPFSTSNSLFYFQPHSSFALKLINVKVTGLAGHFLARVNDASIGSLSLYNVKLNGPIVGFNRANSSGVGQLATSGVTLVNGAILTSNFNVGINC